MQDHVQPVWRGPVKLLRRRPAATAAVEARIRLKCRAGALKAGLFMAFYSSWVRMSAPSLADAQLWR